MKLIAVLATCLLAATPRIALSAPLDAYARGPDISAVHLSPDGKMLAYATHIGDEGHIVVQTIDDRRLVTDLILGLQKLDDIQWAGLQHLLIMTGQDGALPDAVNQHIEHVLIKSVDLKSQTVTALLTDVEGVFNVISSTPAVHLTADGGIKAVISAPFLGGRPSKAGLKVFSAEGSDGQKFLATQDGRALGSGPDSGLVRSMPAIGLGLFEADLTDGKTRVLITQLTRATGWLAGRDGNALAIVETDPAIHGWEVAIRKGDSWKPALTGHGEAPRLIGLDSDGAPIVSIPSDLGVAVQVVSLNSAARDLLRGNDYQRILIEPSSQHVYGGIRLRGDVREHVFIDPEDQKRWMTVSDAYPGATLEWMSSSDDGSRMIVLVTPPDQAPYFGFFDFVTGKPRTIGGAYASLHPSDVSPTTKLEIVASDGTRLSGYVTTPLRKSAKPFPLIVRPPASDTAWAAGGFDALDQALASRGYAIVRVNYRGLVGAGNHALTSGSADLGDRSLSDLTAAVSQLAANGVIDPSRVCILGLENLSGYSALAAAAKEPGSYRCAVAVGGFFNLKKWMHSLDPASEQKWLKKFGVNRYSDPKLTAISPYFQAGKIKAKVMLVRDGRRQFFDTDDEQAMAVALQRAGSAAESLAVQDNAEIRALPSSRIKFLEAVVTFLEKNNPPN